MLCIQIGKYRNNILTLVDFIWRHNNNNNKIIVQIEEQQVL